MASITVQDEHELGTGLIDGHARTLLRAFATVVADNFVDGTEPGASKAYEEYVAETVLTHLTDAVDEITVMTSLEWERVNEIGERADFDNSRGL